MIRLPEGVSIERSERDGVLTVRVRVLTEGVESQPANLRFHGDIEVIRDRMEEDVLRKVASGLDALRLAILEACAR